MTAGLAACSAPAAPPPTNPTTPASPASPTATEPPAAGAPRSAEQEQAQQAERLAAIQHAMNQLDEGAQLCWAAAAEYQVAPRWVVGGQVALEKSDFYQPSRASLYLRYQFEPSPKLLPFPPEPLTTYSRF